MSSVVSLTEEHNLDYFGICVIFFPYRESDLEFLLERGVSSNLKLVFFVRRMNCVMSRLFLLYLKHVRRLFLLK